MTDEVFRQSRKKITPDEINQGEAALESVRNIQQAIAQETGREIPKNFEGAPFDKQPSLSKRMRKKVLIPLRLHQKDQEPRRGPSK